MCKQSLCLERKTARSWRRCSKHLQFVMEMNGVFQEVHRDEILSVVIVVSLRVCRYSHLICLMQSNFQSEWEISQLLSFFHRVFTPHLHGVFSPGSSSSLLCTCRSIWKDKSLPYQTGMERCYLGYLLTNIQFHNDLGNFTSFRYQLIYIA